MTQDDYMTRFRELTDQMREITRQKNTDYAGPTDALKNFNLVAYVGIASADTGILVRMCDKIQRVCNLLNKPGLVLNEKIEDTLLDLANYSLICIIALEERHREEAKAPGQLPQRDV